jgi:DNA-binding transcriptional LysR family regulator
MTTFGVLSETSELRVFASVISHGSFAKAADEHRMTPSGVSKLIARLEDRLGARLLQRTTRKLSLTEVGSIFHSRALKLLHDLSEAEAEVSADSLQPRGVLRLSAPVPFGTAHLSPLIPKMAKLFPELAIDVVLTDRFVDLVDEGFDLAIRLGVLADSRLIARRLCANRRILIASPAYLKRRQTPKTPADLTKHECLIFTALNNAREWRLVSKSGSVVIPVDGRIASNNGEVLFEAIRAGQGIGLGATFLVHEALKRGQVVQVLPGYEFELASVFAVYPSARQLSSKVRAAIDFFAAAFRDPPSWDRQLSGVVKLLPIKPAGLLRPTRQTEVPS